VKRERRSAGTERALHEREITFAALAKVAPVGIMRFDAAGRCNYVNDRWTQISDLTIDEAVGDGWQRAIHPEDRPHVVHRWNLLRLQEDIFREEYRICRRDGSVRWVHAEGVPLRNYSGRLLGFIRAITDVTEHRELESHLQAARSELEDRVSERTAALRAEMRERERLEKEVLETKEVEQRRFSQDLHDGLGQYLTGVLFRLEALERDLAGTNGEAAADAAKIAELVNETINQAHALARGIQPVPGTPDGLMLALAELQQQLCNSRNIKCAFECDEPIALDDPTRAGHIYRIAQEAGTNAIKHSSASCLTITLRPKDGTGELIVADDGKGFDLMRRGTRGNGLGIMKHRARLIGGILKIESAPGRGTIVHCKFPIAK
jgi:PAS domain S-box-containing protein